MFLKLVKYYKNYKIKEKKRIDKNKFLIELKKKYNIKLNKKIELKFVLNFIFGFSKSFFLLITFLLSFILLGFNLVNTSNSDFSYFQENQNLNQESFKNEILKNLVKNENLKSFEEYKKLNEKNFDFFQEYKNEFDIYYSDKDNKKTIALIKKSGEILYIDHMNKENNNFKVNINKNNDFTNYNYDVYSAKYFKFNYMNKDSNVHNQFYEKSSFIPIEDNNFFNLFLIQHFKYNSQKENLYKSNNKINYLYLNTYPLNINYTEKEIEAYENDLKFFEIMTLIYFLSLIITLISLYIPKKYYDTKLIKKERDEFILNEANKKSNYKIEYDNKSFNDYDINKIKKHKNVISI
tara:strand:+ start:2489 stop:3538 length:1050 start_codon:yes stop_codon:yes gene_type:complete